MYDQLNIELFFFLQNHIKTNNFDIFSICKTWLNCTPTNSTYINAFKPFLGLYR